MKTQGDRRTILLVTEGTYPFVMGGVSTWCDQLVTNLAEHDWVVLPIVSAECPARPLFEAPPWCRVATPIRPWAPGSFPSGRRGAPVRPSLAADLVRNLLGWAGDLDALTDDLVWCREHPDAVGPSFRSLEGWDAFCAALEETCAGQPPEAGPAPSLDLHTSVELYQALAWIAHTASVPTPPADLVHVTAAGWAAVPAVVDHARVGTPMLLTEHGVYVREAYLATLRPGRRQVTASRFMSTRIARGLARLAYRHAEVVAPVTSAHAAWERALGAPAGLICPVPNGMATGTEAPPHPGGTSVVSIGRIDPLKDIETLLHVADEVRRRVPDAQFRHYGPVPAGRESYARRCRQLHRSLGLGESFRFMGPTRDPRGALRDAAVAVFTSISEGFPMAMLEAMAEARPVVATAVGGVAEALRGCGLVAAPGDTHGLASAVAFLLANPDEAAALGARGHRRVRERFSLESFCSSYRRLIGSLLDTPRWMRRHAG